MPHTQPTIIWRFIDGKPGHEKQSLGLARALQRLAHAQWHDIDVRTQPSTWLDWILGRFPAGRNLPAPNLLIGAGHATHLPMLAARRARGGRLVVLMRPSLPLGLFDLCLIPEHDQPPPRKNVITTRGALNAVTPTGGNRPDHGLILVGGPSSHYIWNDRAVADQTLAVVAAQAEVRWQLTTSRRTPDSFLAGLPTVLPANLTVLPHTATPPGWLEANLCQSGQAWVTEDSVSMLYEALTAGCTVGLIRLNASGKSRIHRGIDRLLQDGLLTPFEAWQRTHLLTSPDTPLDESERCVEIMRATRFWEPSEPINK
jgi:hypothetical protein